MSNLKQFAESIKSKLKVIQLPGLFGRNNAKKKTIVGIELTERGFSVVELALEGASYKIINCHFVQNTNPNIRGELLVELVQRRKINTENCRLVLSGSSYKFLLAEAPDAPLESLRAIMPAKVKDSLSWKTSECTADVMLLPSDAFRGRKRSVYVAAIDNKAIDETLELLKSVHIEASYVTTIEMAINSFYKLLNPPENTSIGILRLSETSGVIIMMCDGAIYLARRIVVALNQLGEEGVNKQDVYDQVVLEIQRSVDFYESQLGKGVVAKIVILPTAIELGLGFEYIDQNISTTIEMVNPFDLLESEHEITVREGAACIGALGAALEGAHRD